MRIFGMNVSGAASVMLIEEWHEVEMGDAVCGYVCGGGGVVECVVVGVLWAWRRARRVGVAVVGWR